MTREKLIEVMARAICKVNEVSDDVFTEQPLHNRWIEDATAALLALEAAGVRMVPVEATEEMSLAAMDDFSGYMNGADFRCLYRAMLAASPYAPQKDTNE